MLISLPNYSNNTSHISSIVCCLDAAKGSCRVWVVGSGACREGGVAGAGCAEWPREAPSHEAVGLAHLRGTTRRLWRVSILKALYCVFCV